MAAADACAATARSISSVSAAPQTPVRRILALTAMAARHGEIGRSVDIDMADAFEMGEHRHPRLRLHARDQALAAARHDHVDGAAQARRASAPTAARSVVGTSWIASSGRPAARQPLDQAGVDRARRMRRLSEPPRRITALPALRQSAPASAVTLGRLSIDDADDAERRAHALDVQPVGPRPIRRSRRRPDRAARRSRAMPSAMPAMRAGVERQPVA